LNYITVYLNTFGLGSYTTGHLLKIKNMHSPLNLHPNTIIKEKERNSLGGDLYDFLPIAIYTCDKFGYITSFNRAAVKLWGRTPEIGADLWCGSWKIFQINGEPLPLDSCPMARALKEKIAIEGEEIVVERPDGERLNVLPYPVPVFDDDGELTGAVNTLVDISEKRKADRSLKQHAENLETINSVGKLVSESLDIEEILQNVTDATTSLTGADFGAFFYNKLDVDGEAYMLYTLSGAPKEAFEKFGMPRNTAVFHPTFSGEGILRVDDITKDPRYGKNQPHNGMPAGHLPVVSYLSVPVISKAGSVIGGLFYGHREAGRFKPEHETLVSAIAAQAAVALDNAKLYEEIRELNLKKDEFIALASHELKTPVTSLNGYLQILESRLQADDNRKIHVQKALQQVQKLTRLISDLLDVSKIEAGQLPLSPTTFDLIKLVRETVELMQYSTRSHRIEFSCDVHQQLISADKQRIEQVIINLVTNAIKYSPKADLVKISVYEIEDKSVVAVQDFGIGIRKEQQERIFSRFYRVEDLATFISGLGIGLYISKQIICRHQGNLTVTSTLGQGSTFSFELPRVGINSF
jgi:signal transduction histidine kinase